MSKMIGSGERLFQTDEIILWESGTVPFGITAGMDGKEIVFLWGLCLIWPVFLALMGLLGDNMNIALIIMLSLLALVVAGNVIRLDLHLAPVHDHAVRAALRHHACGIGSRAAEKQGPVRMPAVKLNTVRFMRAPPPAAQSPRHGCGCRSSRRPMPSDWMP